MKKPLLIFAVISCVIANIPIADADELPHREFPRQKLKIENFSAKGFILDVGGGGEGVIGRIKKSR